MRRVVLLFVLLCSGLTTAASAQTSVGGHYSLLRDEFPRETRHGLGGFFTYSPGAIGVDVATSVFISGDIGGTAWQVLAGPRVGGVRRRIGAHGRVRPGFIRFSERFYKPDVVCIAIFPPPEACLADRTSFAVDLGLTIETLPSASTVLRFDIGDTLTRYPDTGQGRSDWMHGLQVVAGAGVRF